MMASAMYDSDDACNPSPPMVAAVPNYEHIETPPPFVSRDHEEVARPAGHPRKHQSEPTSTHQGDRVLMGYLAPNVPHLAEGAVNAPLGRSTGEGRRLPQPPDFDPRKLKNPVRSDSARPQGLKAPSIETTKFEGAPQYKQTLSTLRPMQTNHIKQELSPTGSPPARARFHSISEMSRGSSQDVFKHSPELKTQASFPSLQPIKSPQGSGSCLGKSPDNSQTHMLPSIHKALSELSGFGPSNTTASPPFPFSPCPVSTTSGNDSSFDRSLSTKLPAPYSIVSPVSMKDISTNPSPASHSSFWRGPSADMVSAPSPYESSPMNNTSTATSYPTPTEQVGIGMGDRMSFATQPNGGPVGSYKCTHPGCTAAPFQTQYLLNSHANVHSQDRPHFCPVEGCPRSIGGKGFKRKNEMMRHGLVHNSPGYVCPFCPDQQHRYPRPDNLQRHVRVHHVDKSKDDPVLRQVLAQRPMGSARGRKRRMDSI